MPTRKQRRRRQKDRRHEYEYVYVDDEGREVEVDPAELEVATADEPQKKPKPEQKASARRNGAKPKSSGATGARRVPPPSWPRVLKRGAIFAPFMLFATYLLGRGLTWEARFLQTLWLLILFIPFSYLIDRMMYRRYLRQTGESPPNPRQPRA
jgi:hypothetical protein